MLQPPMRPLKILKVVDAWKWFAEAEQMYQATLALVDRGHRVAIACPPDSPAAERAKALGLPTYGLPGLRHPRLPTTPLLNVARLVRAVEDFDPDVVHAYRSPPHVLAAAALGLAHGRPALVRTRAGAQPITRNAANRALYDRLTAATLVSSQAVRRDMVDAGFDPARLVAVPTVVDPAPLAGADGAAFRARLGVADDVPVVSVVGRLAAIKGHRHLVDALPALVARHPSLTVCFAGPEADLAPDTLRDQARRLGVETHLRLLGEVEDVGPVLAGSDVVAICSVGSEVISRILLEAMALARPVVATTVGVIPEVARDRETARLVPPGDPGALAGAIGDLLADRAAAATLGEAAAAAVRAGHLPAHLAAALEAVYGRVAPGP